MLKRKSAAEYFERNLETCCQMTRNFTLGNFLHESPSLLDVYENYRHAYGFSALTFFLTSSVGFGHFGDNSASYSVESNSLTKTSLFLIIVGPSASKKSRYIQKVYDAATTAEKVLFTLKSEPDQMELAAFALKFKGLARTDEFPTPLPHDVVRKITFIEQTLSYPEAMRSLTKSNVFLCAPESDFILDQLNFFDHEKDNVAMRGCASALFDGQTITRSNYHGRTIIENKTLSICVGSTGSKWLNILLHLHDNLTTDGFHPRFLFHCVEPAATIDGKEGLLNRAKPSIIHMYIVRGIMGNRIQVFSPDASEYIQSYLQALNSNKPHPGIKFRATTSYEQVVERRGAELIVRLASNIQYQKDILKVISRVRQLDFFHYDKSFVDQVNCIVEEMFGPSQDLNSGLTTSIHNSKMIITKTTCEEALRIFIDVLMPEHFVLMNYHVNVDSNETPTELKHQTDILKIPYRFFYKTTLFGNQGVLKNIHKDELEHLLNRLVRRSVLKKGKFLKSSKQSGTFESYVKYLPTDRLEEQELISELKKHNIEFDEYRDIYNTSAISPDGTVLTVDGENAIQKQKVDYMQESIPQELNSVQLVPTASNSTHNKEMSILNTGIENGLCLTNAFDEVFTMDRTYDTQINQHTGKQLDISINNRTLIRNLTCDRDKPSHLAVLSMQYSEESRTTEYCEFLQSDKTKHLESNVHLELEQQIAYIDDHMVTVDATKDKEINTAHIEQQESSKMEIGTEELCQSTLKTPMLLYSSDFSEQLMSPNAYENVESSNAQPISNKTSLNDVNINYSQFKDSIPSASTPFKSAENIANASSNSCTLSATSVPGKVIWNFDPAEALANPKMIPPRLLSKCKQMLLSTSPIITKTCWNRRFGGDVNVCSSVTKLLMTVGLLKEGNFVANANSKHISWMKQLPSDSINRSLTLEFQQMKLNIFNVTWQDYAISFKNNELVCNGKPYFISTTVAEILRGKPYCDIGFVLNESCVFSKNDKNKGIHRNVSQAMDVSANTLATSISNNPEVRPDLSSVDSNSEIVTNNDTAIHSNLSNQSSKNKPKATSKNTTPTSGQLSSSIELNNISSNLASNMSTPDLILTKPSTPKRTRKSLSPMRTRSKSRRIDVTE